MHITEVKVFPVSEEKLKAFVSIVVDDCFMINDIKVICGKDGLFVSMPSRKKKNGEFKDVAHPLNNETRQMIEERVLGEYERVLLERGEQPEVGWRRLRVEDGQEREPPTVVTPAVGAPPSREAPLQRAPEAEPALVPAAASSGVDGSGAPAPSHGAPPAYAGARPKDEEEATEGKSLEEVQEMHLRDSFWSVS